MDTQCFIDLGNRYSAQNNKPLDVAANRGKALMVGVELVPEVGGTRGFCERLMAQGLLCKNIYENVIRFMPPLIITRQDIDWALERIKPILAGNIST